MSESPLLVYVQPFQEPVQLLWGDLQKRIRGTHPPFEGSFAQLLVVSFVGEDEHRILEWISIQDRLDICTQSIYAFSKIHRFSDQV